MNNLFDVIYQIQSDDADNDQSSNFNITIKTDKYYLFNIKKSSLILNNFFDPGSTTIIQKYLEPEQLLVYLSNWDDKNGSFNKDLNTSYGKVILRQESKIDNKLNGITLGYFIPTTIEIKNVKDNKRFRLKVINGITYHLNYIAYYVDNHLHRDDGPALEFYNGYKAWFNKGLLHRINRPAIERANGDKHYYFNNLLHRINGPAVEAANGDIEWYQNGELHRINGPAVEAANGDIEWYQNGELHRTDGPAVEKANGTKEWWLNDKRHRINGPAVENANGTKKWFLENKDYGDDEEKYKQVLTKFLAKSNKL